MPTRRRPHPANRAERDRYDAMVSALLEGRRLLGVTYLQLKGLEAPEFWDQGDWHVSVMGVDLQTDDGPVSVTWEGTYVQYGVEVRDGRDAPTSAHDAEYGGPEPTRLWDGLIGTTMLKAVICWVEVAPPESVQDRAGEVRTAGPGLFRRLAFATSLRRPPPPVPPERHCAPAALRLDFEAGRSVWVVAAMELADTGFLVLADEIVVVFTAERMRVLGFTDAEFLPDL